MYQIVLGFLICLTSSYALSRSLRMSFSTNEAPSTSSIHTLYDMPVSNHGARCRIILYKKGIPLSDVKISDPGEIGGTKSDAYRSINPIQKVPSLHTEGLTLGESDTISRYLLDKYPQGPSFQLSNPKSNLIARIHDMYLSTIQGCMYRVPPFGTYGTRSEALREYQRQLNIIDDMFDPSAGMYLCGAEVSLADATLFPTAVFTRQMLPKFDINPPLPEKLEFWFQGVKRDIAFQKVYDEIMDGIHAWEKLGRWDTILGAGWRDTAPKTIFDKIISKEIPAVIVKEDDTILAFKDINPAAPAHIVVIPKHRNGLVRLNQATNEHIEILGRLLVAAGEISKDTSLGFGDGARIVINDGKDGGQEVMHLHVHVLGGRKMSWPPG